MLDDSTSSEEHTAAQPTAGDVGPAEHTHYALAYQRCHVRTPAPIPCAPPHPTLTHTPTVHVLYPHAAATCPPLVSPTLDLRSPDRRVWVPWCRVWRWFMMMCLMFMFMHVCDVSHDDACHDAPQGDRDGTTRVQHHTPLRLCSHPNASSAQPHDGTGSRTKCMCKVLCAHPEPYTTQSLPPHPYTTQSLPPHLLSRTKARDIPPSLLSSAPSSALHPPLYEHLCM
jgi:hypothetical protein